MLLEDIKAFAYQGISALSYWGLIIAETGWDKHSPGIELK